jgi:hypothetical protein
VTFIIAECGVNWRDLIDADQMIKAAAEAGADAVKFQCYNTEFQTRFHLESDFHPRAKELNAIRLDESTIRYLYWRCQQHQIEFMATPMFPEAVAMLKPYVKRWKIRFADRRNQKILKLCRATRKPMLISGKNLFCISEYPPGPKDVKVNPKFKGISSHYPVVFESIPTSFEYLEVHVRLDHYEPPHYCPIDTAVSITMPELAELCRRLKK